MATLKIVNTFELTAQGISLIGKQGTSTDLPSTPFDITVGGQYHYLVGSIATATVSTIYDDDDDFPADWDYLYFWSDQIIYVQLIAGSTNVTHRCAAKQPFVLPGYDSMLPAANSTLITGGTEPTLTDIDSVAIGNYSGSTANYVFAVID